MARDRLCEIISSLANTAVNEHNFEITPPRVEDGTSTSVMIRPRNSTRMYGFQRLVYRRFDLSTLEPREVIYQNEISTVELARRMRFETLYNYRIAKRGVPGFSSPRALHLKAEDVIYMPIQVSSTSLVVRLEAREDSDMFIGSWDVTLRRV